MDTRRRTSWVGVLLVALAVASVWLWKEAAAQGPLIDPVAAAAEASGAPAEPAAPPPAPAADPAVPAPVVAPPGVPAVPPAASPPGTAAPVPATPEELVADLGAKDADGRPKLTDQQLLDELAKRGAGVVAAARLAKWWAVASGAVFILVLLLRWFGALDKLGKRWRAPVAVLIGLAAGLVTGMADGLPWVGIAQLMVSSGLSAIGVHQAGVRGFLGVASPGKSGGG